MVWLLTSNQYSTPICESLFKCNDFNCINHSDDICKVYQFIIDCCLKASVRCLPTTGTSKYNDKSKVIPGWNDYVQDEYNSSLMWHTIWTQCDRPKNGIVADIMRRTRAKYHYAVRHIIKNNNNIRSQKMAEAISQGNGRNLWNEVRKMKKPNNSLPNMVDGKTCSKDICDLFTDKFKNLYNSVGYNDIDMSSLNEEVDAMIKNMCSGTDNSINHHHNISVYELIACVNKMKSDKKEFNGMFSNHIIYGTNMLYDILAKLYNCMLSHGVSPNDMLVGTMVPLQKDRRSAHHCSTNYRALTLGSIIGKLYDSIIINQQAHVFNTSELQFGFKENSSTTQCTFLVNETISYYVNNGTPVYALLLDASKAFDRVNYILLFKKLIKKGMCPLVVRLLLNMYTRQQLQVRWNTNVSAPFTVTNGVRQGGSYVPSSIWNICRWTFRTVRKIRNWMQRRHQVLWGYWICR